MRTIATLILLTTLTTGQGQSRWTIGVVATPSLIKAADYNSDYSRLAPTYGLGISSNYSLNDRLFLNSGLTYKVKRDFAKDIPELKFSFDSNNNIIKDTIGYFKATTNLSFISFPLTVNYKLTPGNTKTTLFLSIGIEANYLVKSVQIRYLTEETETTTWTNNELKAFFDGGINVGIGLLHNLTPNLTMMIKPEYSLDLVTSRYFLPSSFHSLTLNLQMQYRIKHKEITTAPNKG